MNHLHFTGIWNPVFSIIAGACLAAAAWWMYRRDIDSLAGPSVKLLPWLRATAIFLLIEMLAGPVIKYRETVGRMTRLTILIDSSRSMGLTDPELEPARKAAIAAQLGTPHVFDGQAEAFDAMSRTDRARSLLFEGGSDSLISSLIRNFEVHLVSMEDARSRRVWSSSSNSEPSPTSLPAPTFERTDLSAALGDYVRTTAHEDSSKPLQRSVVVLLSDGNHNTQTSPLSAAKLLGDREIPAFCIGFGTTDPPPDLAIQRIEAPESVFKSDRVRGQIFIKDDMPSGVPFDIQILHAGTLAWEQRLITNGQHIRPVKFDFPVQPLLERLAGMHQGGPSENQPVQLGLEALVTSSKAERQTMNNKAKTVVSVVSSKRKMLLLEGRPRWETRYLRNLFDRDPQWDVNAVFFDPMDSSQNGMTLPRGLANGSFPSTRSSLMEYDVVVIGEWNASLLSNEELEWLGEFVSIRGGGMLLVDGPRQTLQTMLERSTAPLVPVGFSAQKEVANESSQTNRLSLTEYAKNIPALSLAAGTSEQSVVWQTLPAPHRITPCMPLPGSEVLVEAGEGRSRRPAVVHRRYGAGKILYCASDETWRWRNNVAGLYQERFWSQIIAWIAAQPFAVQTEGVSLDTNGFVFREGASTELRAFIDPRQARSRPVVGDSQNVTGVLWRNGNRVAAVPLIHDASREGFFSGKSPPLGEGNYELTVESAGLSIESKAIRAPFVVRAEAPNELAEVTQNEALLRQIASESKGRYLPEESIRLLKDLLAPWKDGESRLVEIPIWQGLPWFCVVILLLSTEGWLRKRLGLI
jgi:hypothetical protein